MVSKPDDRVIVRLAGGLEYGLRDAAYARQVYPNGEIVRYIDGRPYGDPEAAQGGPDDEQDGELDYDEIRASYAAQTRPELDAIAANIGIDPKRAKNKGELIELIVAAIEATVAGVDAGGPDA